MENKKREEEVKILTLAVSENSLKWTWRSLLYHHGDCWACKTASCRFVTWGKSLFFRHGSDLPLRENNPPYKPPRLLFLLRASRVTGIFCYIFCWGCCSAKPHRRLHVTVVYEEFNISSVCITSDYSVVVAELVLWAVLQLARIWRRNQLQELHRFIRFTRHCLLNMPAVCLSLFRELMYDHGRKPLRSINVQSCVFIFA